MVFSTYIGFVVSKAWVSSVGFDVVEKSFQIPIVNKSQVCPHYLDVITMPVKMQQRTLCNRPVDKGVRPSELIHVISSPALSGVVCRIEIFASFIKVHGVRL